MKAHRVKAFYYLLIIFIFIGCSTNNIESPLRVMSFNIRYDNPEDGENAWIHRKDQVVSMIRFHKADIGGLQEALAGQVEYLASELPEFGWLGVGRDDGDRQGEFTAIFYRKDRLKSIRNSTFWCSETPEKPRLGWDAVCNRTVTWSAFVDRYTQTPFYVFNTHFDHRGVKARQESARLLLRKVYTLAGNIPVIITGDFNCIPGSEPYVIITGSSQRKAMKQFYDARHISENGHHGPTGTFTGFNINAVPAEPIDFIFVSDDWNVLFHANLSDTFDGRLPSDHMPVLVEIVIK
jgi:endonuclease/exonuclease/phosphatase family metal-dependent hydrolase